MNTSVMLNKEDLRVWTAQTISIVPPLGIIKFNVDAVVNSTSSTIVVVAKKDKGEVTKAWAKGHISCYPLVAEAQSIDHLGNVTCSHWKMFMTLSQKGIPKYTSIPSTTKNNLHIEPLTTCSIKFCNSKFLF